MIEMDRILRPEGTVIIRDTPTMLARVSKVAKAIQWKYEIFDSEPGTAGRERIFVATKQFWRAEVAESQ
jgi:methylase of polypeptide subunit release factors